MKIFKGRNKVSGFTLLEGLVSCVIGLILMGMAMGLYVQINEGVIIGATLAEVNSNARVGMGRIVRDLRSARNVLNEYTYSGHTYKNVDGDLILEIPSVNGAGDFIDIGATFDYVIYTLVGGDNSQLRRIRDPNGVYYENPDQVIAHNINSFSFGGTDSIEVAINVSKEPFGQNDKNDRVVNEAITSEVRLRNN